MTIHYILSDETGQTLSHVPIKEVSAALFIIEDLLDGLGTEDRIIASGSVTLSTVSALTDVDAGPAQAIPKKIPVETTSGFSIGDRCFILHPDGFGEQFKVDGLSTEDYLLADQPLMNAYPCLSTVSIIELSADFPDATAADASFVNEERPLRVIWEYTIDGNQQKHQEEIRVVRQDFGDMNLSDAMLQVRKAFPDLTERLPTGTTLRDWAEFALSDLEAQLLGKGIDPKDFLTGKQATQILAWRILCHAADNGSAPGGLSTEEFRETCQKRLDTLWNNLFIGKPGKETGELDRRTDTVSSNRILISRNPFKGL